MILDHVGSVKMSSILTLIILTKSKTYETVWHHEVIAYWSFTNLFPFVYTALKVPLLYCGISWSFVPY